MTHPAIYRMLRAAGHSPFGANDVLVAARRKGGKQREDARRWIGVVFSVRRTALPKRASA